MQQNALYKAVSPPHTSVMGPESGDLPALLAQLRDGLGFRRVEQGIQTLERHRDLIAALAPGQEKSGILLGLVAQWVDAGFAGAALLRELLARFPRESRAALPLLEYLHIRMAEGWLAMAAEDFDRALEHFRFIDSLASEVDDPELLAIANFWAGRCLRKTGRYDDAASYTARGQSLAEACGYSQMAALMQTTQSWLAFQKGRLKEAAAILRRAEDALVCTDDYASRGNVQSAYGRIARRQGRYDHALEYFRKAIAEYRKSAGSQLRLARALLNMAFVNRLIALGMQKSLDNRAASRRSSAEPALSAEQVRAERLGIERIRADARAQLDECFAIFDSFGNHRGIAGSHINIGLLHLDGGDLECASAEAAEAFYHGEEKHDFIVMARARTLQCMIENGRLEEQIGDPRQHFENAESYARDAVHFASQTQNRRLLARAYVWQGLTWTKQPYGALDDARRCCEQATALLRPESLDKEYVWEDLEELKAAVLNAGPVDPILRAWSSGLVGDRSFQQISEEFARIIIPKVWEREGRKISRVAARLSISPKKVRRILNAMGLL
jgi:tetratricopeptide (TPR) repeat protein